MITMNCNSIHLNIDLYIYIYIYRFTHLNIDLHLRNKQRNLDKITSDPSAISSYLDIAVNTVIATDVIDTVTYGIQ